MKFIYCVLALCVSTNSLTIINDEWFVQKQNHFDENNNVTWKQVLQQKYKTIQVYNLYYST